MILSINDEKAFDKFQHPFIINKKKNLSKVGIEGNFLNLIKDVYKNPTANIVLNGEKLELSHKYLVKARMSPLTTPFQPCTEVRITD